MPLDALYSAATGMLAQQTALDNISNNLANVNTAGFKSGRTAFADLLYTDLTPQQAAKQGNQVGLGVQVSAIQTQMGQGNLQTTGNATRPRDPGRGLLRGHAGQRHEGLHARRRLHLRRLGQLVTPTGEKLSPPIIVPSNATDTAVGQDGTVTAKVNGKLKTLGQIRSRRSRTSSA